MNKKGLKTRSKDNACQRVNLCKAAETGMFIDCHGTSSDVVTIILIVMTLFDILIVKF